MTANLTITHVITGEQLADQFNGMDSDEISEVIREMFESMDDDTVRCFAGAVEDAHGKEAIDRGGDPTDDARA